MPYLQVDLDALDAFEAAARHAGIDVGAVCVGFLRLWKRCWQKKTATIERALLGAFFPGDLERNVVAFTVCEFLDVLPEGTLRVRGAEKRLGFLNAKSEAGKKGGAATASKGKSLANLRQNQPVSGPDSASAAASGPASVSASVGTEADASALLQQNRGSEAANTEALTSSIQHLTSNVLKETLRDKAAEGQLLELQPLPPEEKAEPDVDEVMQHYLGELKRAGKHPRDTDGGRKLIRKRRKDGVEVHVLKDAISGLTWSEFHREQGFTALKYAIRNDDQIQLMLEKLAESRRPRSQRL